MIPTQEIIKHPTLGNKLIITFETQDNNAKIISKKIDKKRIKSLIRNGMRQSNYSTVTLLARFRG